MDSHEDNNLSKVKSSIIEEINRRYEDHSIEETNAALIKRLVQKSETINDALMIWNLGTRFSKTGIQFDRDFEKVLDEKDTIHYLKRNPKLSFKTDENAPLHKLIIGENFYALKNLLISYRGKVDVIYIDPPYGKDSMGEFAATNYHNALSRDNLLTMLEIRLEIAKMLLSDTGVIFCSIDDKNQAYVKCLFDDIFGERNFVANMPRKTRTSATTKSDAELQVLHDYVIMYFKDRKNAELKQNKIGEKTYPYSDGRGRYYVVPLQDNGPHGTRTARPNLYYPIYVDDKGCFSLEVNNNSKKYLPKMHKNDDGCWMWSREKFIKDKDDLTIHNDTVYIKHYYCEEEYQNKYQKYKTWLDVYTNSSGTIELGNILGKGNFDNPKPLSLIKWLVDLSNNPDATVLDFFAGSGTTAQAVQELNKEDGGSRECILVQMDEKTATTPNGIPTDVTSKRLKRVMTGSCYDGSADFEWIKKHAPIGGNLDVYEIGEVSVYEDNEGQSAFDVIDETIYGCEKFGSLKERVDWICSNFSITTPKIKQIKQRDENA